MDWLQFGTVLGFIDAGEFYAAAAAVLWAVAVILFRKSGERISPLPLNFFKNTLALPLYALTMLVFGVPLLPEGVSAADCLVLICSGMLGIGIADAVFFASLNRLGAGRSAIVDCFYSPAVALCSAVYLGEPHGPLLWAAMALMAVAIMLGAWNPEDDKKEKSNQLRTGVALGILAMFLMAVGIVIAKPVLNHTDPLWATVMRLLGGWALLAPQCLLPRFRSQVKQVFSPGSHWRYALPGTFVGTYLAMFVWILGMKYTYTNIAAVLNQSSSVFVLLLATLFLREAFTLRRGVAVALGVTAAVLVSLQV